MYVMVDFICKGYLELSRLQVQQDSQKKTNSCQLWDLDPGPSAYEAKTLPLSNEELNGIAFSS